MPQDRSQFKHAQDPPFESGAESAPESRSIASAGQAASQKLGQEAFAKSKAEPLQQAKVEPLQQAKLFGEGIVSGLALNSINGATQFSNESFGTNFKAIHLGAQSEIDSSIAGNVGKMIGTTALFIGLALATKKVTSVSPKMLGSAALSESVAFGTAGAIQGGLLTPTQKDLSGSSFFLARGGEALLGSGSAVLGAQGARVAKLFQASAPSLGVTGSRLLSLGAGGIFDGGLGAGTAHVYSKMHTGKWASKEEVANSAILSAGIGLGASALSFGKLGSPIAGLKSQDQIPARSSLTPSEFAQISEYANGKNPDTQGAPPWKSELYLRRNVSPGTRFVSPDPIGELTNGKFRAAEGSESGTSLQSTRPAFSQHKLNNPEAVQQELNKVFGPDNLAPIKDGRDFEFSKLIKTEHGDVELKGLYRNEYNDFYLSLPPAKGHRPSMLIKLDKDGRPNQVNLVNDSNGFFSSLFGTMGAKQLASDLGSPAPKALSGAAVSRTTAQELPEPVKPSREAVEANNSSPESSAVSKRLDLREKDLRTVDLSLLDLVGADLSGANLSNRVLNGIDLSGAILRGTNLEGASMNEARLVGADLTDARMRNVQLRMADLTKANLSEARILSADLTGAKLNGATMRGTGLRSATMHGAHLRGADLTYAEMPGAKLERADLSDAILSGASLDSAILNKANMNGVLLKGARLNEVNLNGSSLKGADLSDAVMAKAQLREADLTNAVMDKAQLREADLTNAVMDKAQLRKADLRNAKMPNASLREADLSEANLYDADLSEGQLAGAKLEGAVLEGASFNNANLEAANLKGAAALRVKMPGANLSGAQFMGADMRRADVTNADFTGAIFSHSDNSNPADFRFADLTNAVFKNAETSPESPDLRFATFKREQFNDLAIPPRSSQKESLSRQPSLEAEQTKVRSTNYLEGHELATIEDEVKGFLRTYDLNEMAFDPLHDPLGHMVWKNPPSEIGELRGGVIEVVLRKMMGNDGKPPSFDEVLQAYRLRREQVMRVSQKQDQRRGFTDVPDVTVRRWMAEAIEIANDHFEKWGFIPKTPDELGPQLVRKRWSE